MQLKMVYCEVDVVIMMVSCKVMTIANENKWLGGISESEQSAGNLHLSVPLI